MDVLMVYSEPYRASAGRRRRTRERNHFLNGQTEFEPVQRVTDTDLPLNLRVRQVGHDGAALHIGTAGCHIPSRHPDPQLGKHRGDMFVQRNVCSGDKKLLTHY